MNLQGFQSVNGGQVTRYSRSLVELPAINNINDITAILLSGDLYGENLLLPQQGFSPVKSLIYSFRPLFNLASTAPPNDGFSKTASPSYTDLPMVVVFNQTTGQIVYIGGGNAIYANDTNAAGYTVAPAFLSVQGSVPFYANISDNLQVYAIQNQNGVARPIGFLNLLFATFDIAPWSNTQGAFYNAVSS